MTDERAAFEAWYRTFRTFSVPSFQRHMNLGAYENDSVEFAWRSWQAACAAKYAEIEQLKEVIINAIHMMDVQSKAVFECMDLMREKDAEMQRLTKALERIACRTPSGWEVGVIASAALKETE